MKLKIFAISDIHSSDDFTMPELNSEEFDLLITLGDIPENTLDYILFMGRRIQDYGVHGNHDPKDMPGINDLHCKVVVFKGIKISGFGGAQKYKDHPNHYTEREVAKGMKKIPKVDVFISHSPPYAVSMNEDRIHQGFKAFDEYIEKKSPKYWLHGHLERNYETMIGQTKVIGIAGKRLLTLEF